MHTTFVSTRPKKIGVTALTISDHDHFMKVINSLSFIGTLYMRLNHGIIYSWYGINHVLRVEW